ncbi:RING finger protein 214 [Nerophis lumbriciformis]|uniref:RING finger protein 214 n=1 Tax=Nerophis lumbriciformis TaxID=546530 RepID=UPI002ADFF4F2|nr:RING finger protein 214-like [Nerophis lumbriciformis]XP_061835940.1 RING finger protein 214-like [Nerophis lumbriciformis]
MDANWTTMEEFAAEFSLVTMRDLQEKSMQTDEVMDASTGDAGVNTDVDWEAQVAAMFAYSDVLAKEHSEMMKTREKDEGERGEQTQQLQKKKSQTTRQHQVLLEKLDSLRVKLQLNNAKSGKKNFLSKKQEMTSERSRAEEERNRLAQELRQSDAKLVALTEEQREEQRRWQEELEALRKEVQRVAKETREAEKTAVQDELAAVEIQRDVAMGRIKAWLAEVAQYLSVLQRVFPQQYQQEKPTWAGKEAAVRRNQVELQRRFQEVLQLLQQGRDLESLPRINVAALPHVPTADLKFRQMMNSLLPAPPPRPSYFQPPPNYRPQYFPPPPHYLQRHAMPPPLYPPYVRAPARLPPPPSQSLTTPAYPVVPSPPLPSSGPLEKVLDRLGARFPQCSRNQLTLLLQQVKSARGTLAGMSVDQVAEQVGLKLAQGDTFPSRPPPPASQLCLMCQNAVDPESRHPLSCSHAIHQDCIRIWLQSSPNKSCPFCPAK